MLRALFFGGIILSNDFNSSRSGYRAKRKKTNIVLNTLIVVVLLLIIFVAYNIFASGNDNASSSPKKESTKTEQKQTTETKKSTDTKKKEEEAVSTDDQSSADATADDQESEETTAPEQPDDTQAVVTDEGSSSTSQTGDHKMTFEGEDWQAMINAISNATGLDQSNMTVYWLGSDKSTTNAAVGTVASKDKSKKYKVYIKWVDGQGYVPTKVEELSSIQ
ncbi:DNA primase [Neobacillus cucumis]|uniref:DNA primase n=1 Tax=Neobacillus cucumis TaxID=1740721 RepID=A0A2N5H6T6_9BACI|nr:DNA primase [Neobacillus cucumis]